MPMDKRMILLPLMLGASPALAQTAAPASQSREAQLAPPVLDPATADRLGNVMQGLSKAFLDMKVGEVQAALEGRQPTLQEKKMTVRDLARRDDPNFDRKFQRQIADVGPKMRQSMKALNEALPAITQALQQASEAVERAAANMPDPTYPRR
jgi:uncharacterized protein YukE